MQTVSTTGYLPDLINFFYYLELTSNAWQLQGKLAAYTICHKLIFFHIFIQIVRESQVCILRSFTANIIHNFTNEGGLFPVRSTKATQFCVLSWVKSNSGFLPEPLFTGTYFFFLSTVLQPSVVQEHFLSRLYDGLGVPELYSFGDSYTPKNEKPKVYVQPKKCFRITKAISKTKLLVIYIADI